MFFHIGWKKYVFFIIYYFYSFYMYILLEEFFNINRKFGGGGYF